MRPALLLVLALSACSPDPEEPARVPVAAPRPPVVSRPPAAPLERIAFHRPDGLWTAGSDGGDVLRIVPPTLPRAAEPTWSSDRRWIAFSAAVDPDAHLYPRNLFVARPDGADLRQVTPMPRAGHSVDDLPKGAVRGRAVLIADQSRRPLPGLRVTAHGLRNPGATDSEGYFQTFLPAGGGWIKLSGEVDGNPLLAWRYTAAVEGRVIDLKDVALNAAIEDLPGSPAWCDQDRQLLYVMKPGSLDRTPGAPRSTLRRIRVDGSGDESVIAFASASIIAGPVVRGDSAWLKMSNGQILRLDLKTKTVAESRPGGLSAPDVLAVSPDGTRIATLKLETAGSKSLLLLTRDGEAPLLEFKPGDASPRGLDFSPDGTRLVLDLAAADGSSKLALLTIATRTLVPLLESGASPVWHGR